ncbi:haloacid dehalogenase-like hydrolase [Candidatus Tachikawaea gelatinosa]|uniref:HAD superfamily (Subfamily IF) hydrolase YfhB n=1 Tax=Candidatus Tachikawaea gelatinosa TaxID=1410383 RepID=A0A090ALM6_9ENTR|nr:haloacid dehalogenase-like hydrolase [Candidatus Tachikawaea gelatinosa]BAP58549.1 HAD superfamily (Subfamily IF) hydrolase YfhB [Candidatus Tachikawaea gelatinosa]
MFFSKEYILKKKLIFFDLDGTLHKQDMFRLFIFYLLIYRFWSILLVFIISPIIILTLLFSKKTARQPISLLLWAITFGCSKKRLLKFEQNFSYWFRKRIKPFPLVHNRLIQYLNKKNTAVWIISGSPESLIKKVYYDAKFFNKINLIGSKIEPFFFGYILTSRCIGLEKVSQLEKKIGKPLSLYSGYSDSKNDKPLLFYCKYKWKVTRNGNIKKNY